MFLGTAKDNSRDRDRKGRLGNRLGSANGNAKLNEMQARLIKQARKQGFKRNDIAKYFNVSVAAIDDIIYNRRWKLI